MKLNGLTKSLKDESTLSNQYLSHIVELLRKELASYKDIIESAKEHIEEQKTKVTTKSINDLIFLDTAVNVIADLLVNGKRVLTEETFTGPFTYFGKVNDLPTNPIVGGVYIKDNVVYIYNGTDYDTFDIPTGTVTKTEYQHDQQVINTKITETINKLEALIIQVNKNKNDIQNITNDLNDKINEAPADNKAYIRKNKEWEELNEAINTVPRIIENSRIEHTAEGIKITTPKITINDSEIPVVNKFGLEKEIKKNKDYFYDIEVKRANIDATSFNHIASVVYDSSYHEAVKSPPQKYSVFTKNWQYTKWKNEGANSNQVAVMITAMNKDGKINTIKGHWTDWINGNIINVSATGFITFHQEYVPPEYEDTVYMFCECSNTPNKAVYLTELKNGEFSRKIDLKDSLVKQGYNPVVNNASSRAYFGTCGKGLRNKDIQRICIVPFNVDNSGASWVIIIGGDKNSALTDPFDPTKCIYVKLPATAYYGFDDCAATDTAWYLPEEGTNRMLRVTADGQVSEVTLSDKVLSAGFNYIEYTDKNNRPACAYYIANIYSTTGYHYVVFLQEDQNGQVNLIERQLKINDYIVQGQDWYAQLFKFIENSHYIFFTVDCGYSITGTTNYGSTTMHNRLWYWDKKTLTVHCIKDVFSSINIDAQSFIEMYKTKGNSIWLVPNVQNIPPEKRTGQLFYIDDIDYTDIENDKDKGTIILGSATVGTNHSFFSSSENTDGWNYYTRALQGGPQWNMACNRMSMAATNDDGILCIMSHDLKAFALCYGSGNIQVYEASKNDKRIGGAYECDGDKTPIIPDELASGNSWIVCSPTLNGYKHGWMLDVVSASSGNTYGANSGNLNRSYTWIGVKYKNGQPTILERPHISYIQRQPTIHFPVRVKWEKYGYLCTYDDYERRKKVLSGIRAYINYGNSAAMGYDIYFKEYRKDEKQVLKLTYDNKDVAEVDL